VMRYFGAAERLVLAGYGKARSQGMLIVARKGELANRTYPGSEKLNHGQGADSNKSERPHGP
jgi:hypothetical protein